MGMSGRPGRGLSAAFFVAGAGTPILVLQKLLHVHQDDEPPLGYQLRSSRNHLRKKEAKKHKDRGFLIARGISLDQSCQSAGFHLRSRPWFQQRFMSASCCLARAVVMLRFMLHAQSASCATRRVCVGSRLAFMLCHDVIEANPPCVDQS